MKNPWKTLSTQIVYKNPWIEVREDQVITPRGQPGIYGYVVTKPALGIVPLTEDLNTYLVGQYRYTLNNYSWELPEGGGHTGESLLETAKRELLEETGLSASKWTSLGTIHTSNSFTDEIATIYLAEALEQGQPKPDDTEQLAVKKIPFMEAYRMVIEGEIKDAMSVFGIFKAHFFLRSQNRIPPD